jgi:hypothetical protein
VHNLLRVAAIDRQANTLKTMVPATYPLVRRSQHDRSGIRLLNDPQVLDAPGEWIVQSTSRRIWLYPRDGIKPSASTVMPTLYELLRIEGEMDAPVEGVVIDGVTFRHTLHHEWGPDEKCNQHDWESIDTANALVRLRNAKNCIIRNCLIEMGGSTGVRFDQLAQRNILENSEVSQMGSNGVFLGGLFFDPRDVNRENVVLNNHIHGIGLFKKDGVAIMMAQSGFNRIAYNKVHNVGYSGIVLTGFFNLNFEQAPQSTGSVEGWANRRELGRLLTAEFMQEAGFERKAQRWPDLEPYLFTRGNRVEYNELFETVLRVGDGNAIYARGAGPDNLIRRNYIHNNLGFRYYGGIRMDDGQYGATIEENVLYLNGYAGITIKEINRVRNNIIVDVTEANDPLNVHRLRNLGYFEFFVNTPVHGLGLPSIAESEIKGNIFLNTRAENPNLIGYITRHPGYLRARNSAEAARLIADKVVPRNFSGNFFWDACNPQSTAEWVPKGNYALDPMLVNPATGDFSFARSSPALEKGLPTLNVNEMGIRREKLPDYLRNRL